VLLVGHWYGDAVITIAGADAKDAVGFVDVAAFALDEGEAFSDIYGTKSRTPDPTAPVRRSSTLNGRSAQTTSSTLGCQSRCRG
jgi:hypothetical protein